MRGRPGAPRPRSRRSCRRCPAGQAEAVDLADHGVAGDAAQFLGDLENACASQIVLRVLAPCLPSVRARAGGMCCRRSAAEDLVGPRLGVVVGRLGHGAGGVTSDFGLARQYASMRTMRLADGPDEVHNRAIARNEFKKYRDNEYSAKVDTENKTAGSRW